MAKCEVCFRHCELKEGQLGFCGARVCREGHVRAENYGRITSLALDPIEKKPLNRFHPGSRILSAGSYGCNLRCPFCQNHTISWDPVVRQAAEEAEFLSPEDLAQTALYYKKKGNIGVAFTYNEPLVGYEYVRDTAKIVRDLGMVSVLVTNGTAELSVLQELAPYIDAMNIDLKGYSDRYYHDVLGGDLHMVRDFITEAARTCHVELTTLIVPGENDTEEEMRQICEWIAGLSTGSGDRTGREIPLHISRFFPRFHMTHLPPTDVKTIYHLADTAREYLDYVYTGNC